MPDHRKKLAADLRDATGNSRVDCMHALRATAIRLERGCTKAEALQQCLDAFARGDYAFFGLSVRQTPAPRAVRRTG